MAYRRRLASLALGLGCCIAWPAQAYMAPQAYVEMRAGAAYHLQLRVKRVDSPRGPRGPSTR